MRDYGKVSPQFWIGTTGRELRGDPEAQLIALYLMTCPHANMIGVFHCPLAYIVNDTGIPIEGARKALARLSEALFCTYSEESEVVFVHQMAKYQISESLKPEDKQVLGIAKEYLKIAQIEIRRAFRGIYLKAFHLPDDPELEEALGSPLQAPPKPRTRTGAGTREEKPLSGKPDAITPEIEVLEHLNRKSGSAYRRVDSNLIPIRARIAESSLEQVKAVIDAKCAQWGSDPKMAEYLRPMTLFSPKNFENYLGQLCTSAPSGPWYVLAGFGSAEAAREAGHRESA